MSASDARPRALFERFGRTATRAGFQYRSVPSLITRSTLERQGSVTWNHTYKIDDFYALGGSAEQSLLDHWADQSVQPGRYWTHTQCFRNERAWVEWKTLREFRKTELFSFYSLAKSEVEWNTYLRLVGSFLDTLEGVRWRVTDVVAASDFQKSVDVEVWTKRHGWLETHTLTDWGSKQIERLGMRGADLGTISCTGLASPRILTPYGENVPLGEEVAAAVLGVEPSLRADTIARTFFDVTVRVAQTSTGPRRINRLLHWKMKTDVDWTETPPRWAPANLLHGLTRRATSNANASKLEFKGAP